MRTLKKTLCVVLCLAMMIGLCVIGTSAVEFTDADKINHKEAVDLLTAIGVINGKPDGDGYKYDPQGTLTRAEAAKIITYVLGYEDIKGSASFSDTKGHWAEGPISLCASEGIVNGVGDNMFDPDGTLIGSAWAKMLLCAIGYNADYEGMTGTDWEIGVAKVLKDTSLLDGVKGFDGTKNVDRDTAAQMAFNALSIPVKKFKEGMKISGSGINVEANGEYDLAVPYTTLGEKNFDLAFNAVGAKGELATTIDIVDSTQATVAGQKYCEIGGVKYSFELPASLVGHQLEFYAEQTADTNGVFKGLTYTDLTKEVVITPTMTNAKLVAAFKAAGIKADQAAAPVYQNGEDTGATQAVDLTNDTGATYAGTFLVGVDNAGRPITIGLKLDDLTDEYVITDVNTEKKTISFGGGDYDNGATKDEVNEYDGIAKGDYVIDTLCGDVHNLVKVTTVEGKITKKDGTKITVGGKTYDASAATINDAVTGDVAVNLTDFVKEYTIYLAEDGYVGIVEKTAEVDTTLVYAIVHYTKNKTFAGDEYNAATSAVMNYLQCIDMDGNTVNYMVKTADAGIAVNKFYKVALKTEKDAGHANATVKATAYEYANLTAVAPAGGDVTVQTSANTENLGADLAATAKKETIGGDSYYFDSAMKVFYIGTQTGANLKVTSKTGPVAVANGTTIDLYGTKTDKTTSNYTVKYMIIRAAETTTVTGSGIVYANETADSTVEVPISGGSAYEHTVYIDGAKTTIKMADADAQNGAFTYSVDAKGVYTLNAYANVKGGAVNGQITNVYNGLVTFDDQTDVSLASAKLVNLVTGDNASKVAKTAAELTTAEKIFVVYDSNTFKNPTVVYVIGYTAP